MSAEQPPSNIKAEEDVLGAMMLDESVIPAVLQILGPPPGPLAPAELLEESRFLRYAHQVIYKTIVDIWDVGGNPDPTVVAADLSSSRELERVGGLPTLTKMISQVPTTSNAAVYARIVAEAYAERQIWTLRHRLQDASPNQARQLIEQWAERDRLSAPATAAPTWANSLVAGGSFILDAPATPRAVWGRDDEIAWADGEALMICGPPGVGKTTLVVQLVAGRLGIVVKDVLGLPVLAGQRRVLYLAMDRPPQISRAMARILGPEHRDVLEERLVVWKGPPPADFARNTGLLAEMCHQAGADTVIVDSLKDAVLKLSDDESGSGYNRARQQALVEGVQVAELHHQRKAGGENKKPDKLDDVYGSTWLTAGAGSVILLWGQAGDPIVELIHLKQPLEPLGPWRIIHDHTTGLSEVYHQADLLQMARHQGSVGLTPKLAAVALFATDKPTASEIEKARRKLNKLVGDGYLVCRAGDRRTDPASYFLVVDEKMRAAS